MSDKKAGKSPLVALKHEILTVAIAHDPTINYGVYWTTVSSHGSVYSTTASISGVLHNKVQADLITAVGNPCKTKYEADVAALRALCDLVGKTDLRREYLLQQITFRVLDHFGEGEGRVSVDTPCTALDDGSWVCVGVVRAHKKDGKTAWATTHGFISKDRDAVARETIHALWEAVKGMDVVAFVAPVPP